MAEKSKGKFLLASVEVVTFDVFDYLFMYIHNNFQPYFPLYSCCLHNILFDVTPTGSAK